MCPADTSPEAWEIVLDLQRKMSPSQRLQYALQWSDVVRQFQLAGVRRRHPNADEREVFLRAAQINLGKELFQKVYGDVVPD
jgi:hypothetical protein